MPRQSEKSDHDILITLQETVNQQHRAIMEKITSVQGEVMDMKKIDLKDLRESNTRRVENIESRLDAYDKISAELQPMKLKAQIDEDHRWITEFKITWRAVLLMAGGISALITFVLTTLIHIFNLIGKAGGR